ncbi:MAG: hypothetical protein U0796_23770 [Gemmatales bacterium]
MKLRRFAGWLLAITVSILTGWIVQCASEPQPLWAIPPSDPVVFTHYQASTQRLVGMRSVNNSCQHLAVVDAITGKELAQCEAPYTASVNHSGQAIDLNARLVGESVYRFMEVKDGKGERTLELRRWRYGISTQEEVVSRWANPDVLPALSALPISSFDVSWSSRHPGLVIVNRWLPTAPLLLGLSNALQPNVTGQLMSHWQFWEAIRWISEVWVWQDETQGMRKVNKYVTSKYDKSPPYHLHQFWSADGMHYGRTAFMNGDAPAMHRVNALTGESRTYSPFPEYNRMYDLADAGRLLMLPRHGVNITMEKGQKISQLMAFPDKRFKETWSLDQWRPLVEAETLQPVSWPQELNESIVGTDRLLADPLDPARYLYFSSVWDQSPYYSNPNGHVVAHVVLLRNVAGKLMLENRCEIKTIPNCNRALLCGQLFVEGSQMHDWHPMLAKIIGTIPWVSSRFSEWLKVNARFVTIIEPATGKMLWKRLERSVDDFVPLPGADRVLFRQNINGMQSGYECWALPIAIPSAWRGWGVGFLIIIAYSLVQRFRRKRSNSAKSLAPTSE